MCRYFDAGSYGRERSRTNYAFLSPLSISGTKRREKLCLVIHDLASIISLSSKFNTFLFSMYMQIPG